MRSFREMRAAAVHGPAGEHADLQEVHGKFGKEFRKWAVAKHMSGEWSASDLAIVAYYSTHSCGHGLEDLAIHPDQATSHGNDHIKLVLGREIPDPEMTYIPVPLYDKRSCRRIIKSIPFRPVHHVLGKKHHAGQLNPNVNSEFRKQPAFVNHTVRAQALEAGYSDTMIRPVSLYQDGVQFTKNNGFEGFSTKDLLSGISYLQCLLRTGLNF